MRVAGKMPSGNYLVEMTPTEIAFTRGDSYLYDTDETKKVKDGAEWDMKARYERLAKARELPGHLREMRDILQQMERSLQAAMELMQKSDMSAIAIKD